MGFLEQMNKNQFLEIIFMGTKKWPENYCQDLIISYFQKLQDQEAKESLQIVPQEFLQKNEGYLKYRVVLIDYLSGILQQYIDFQTINLVVKMHDNLMTRYCNPDINQYLALGLALVLIAAKFLQIQYPGAQHLLYLTNSKICNLELTFADMGPHLLVSGVFYFYFQVTKNMKNREQIEGPLNEEEKNEQREEWPLAMKKITGLEIKQVRSIAKQIYLTYRKYQIQQQAFQGFSNIYLKYCDQKFGQVALFNLN
ncbi:Cyclin-like protein [Pseudocohnilembus persalinus]|uniref:Cyclin-like protein n=1 Tax=Pseudocohnilembus persalinus TaxID=266149 RepID=A0A0V0R5J0_PSEPJ|nr:Cyclin-like protein [Pseudocohnilembus persalinus]|eukprot:KRX09764.1 Cyclin-like protein [Pseudocohnilembus persalinus]